MNGLAVAMSRDEEKRTFHGSLFLKSRVKGVFGHRVELSPSQLTLRPWARPNRTLAWAEVTMVEIHRVRLPLWWRTYVRFRLVDGVRASKLFTPWRVRALREALGDLGWAMSDLPTTSLRRSRTTVCGTD